MQIPAGEDIRTARENEGLTQSELAEQAGVSQPLIARIEGEDVDPTIDTLYSVVSALNSSTAELGQEEVSITMPSALKEARERSGYTQGELARVADVSQPLISRIERQDVNPRASTLRELFSHLEPRPGAGDDAGSTQFTADSDLMEKIEWEFENVEGSSSQSGFEAEESSTGEAMRCGDCGSSFSIDFAPSYCPNCGNEL